MRPQSVEEELQWGNIKGFKELNPASKILYRQVNNQYVQFYRLRKKIKGLQSLKLQTACLIVH